MEPPLSYQRQHLAALNDMLGPDDDDDDDEEGSDHAYNANDMNYTPQRPQHQHVELPSTPHIGEVNATHHTPHGAMTSILSAAGYSPPKKERNVIPAAMQENDAAAAAEESATKKALRKRASKYFHRSASRPAPSNTKNSSKNATEDVDKAAAVDKTMDRADSNSDATTAMATTTTASTISPGSSQSVQHQTATANADASSAVATANNSRPPTHNSNSSSSRSKSPFFPRTAIISPKTIPIQPQSNTSPPNTNTDQPSSTTTQQYDIISSPQSSQERLYSDRLLSSPSADDPDLQLYPSDIDVQSNATSGYISGSDLEIAARRILLRGKINRGLGGGGGRMSSSSLSDMAGENGNERRESVKSSAGSIVGSCAAAGGGSSTGNSRKALPAGWRERIQRKTGIQVPKMAETKPGRKENIIVNGGEEKSMQTTNVERGLMQQQENRGGREKEMFPNENAVPQSMPRSALNTSGDYSYHNNVDGQYSQLGYYQNDGGHGMMNNRMVNNNAMTNAMPNNNNNDQPPPPAPSPMLSEYDDQYYPEDLEDNGAFPNYNRVEGGQIDRMDGGLPTADLQHGRNGRTQGATVPGNVQGGNVGYPANGYPMRAGSNQYQDRYHGRNQQRPNQQPNHYSQQPRHFSSTTVNYEYQNEDEYHHEADGEFEGEENEQYYNHQEWDPDDVAMERTNSGGGNGWGDPRGDFRPVNPILRVDLITRNDQASVNEFGDDQGAGSYQTARTINSAMMSNSNAQSAENRGFIPIHDESDDFPATPKTDDLVDFVPTSLLKPLTQHTTTKRVRFSSSVEGDAGGASDLDSEGFNDDEYFHRFYSETTEVESGTASQPPNDSTAGPATSWEEIPSPMVQWESPSGSKHSPRERHASTDNNNHPTVLPTIKSFDSYSEDTDFNVENFWGEEDSAWSVTNNKSPGTTTATTSEIVAAALGTSTTTNKTSKFDLFAWNEDDDVESSSLNPINERSPGRGGVISSTPQWKLRKLNAEKQSNILAATNDSFSLAELNAMKKEIESSFRTSDEEKAVPNKERLSESKKSQTQVQQLQSTPQPVYVLSEEDGQKSRSQVPEPQHNVHPFSDGDVSDMGYETSDIEGTSPSPGRTKSRSRGLRFFGSRNRKYNSEGERSDNDYESDGSKFSFSLSPSRGRKKKKKMGFNTSKGRSPSSMQSKSPRRLRLFGQRHNRVEEGDGDEAVAAAKQYYRTYREANDILVGLGSSPRGKVGEAVGSNAVKITESPLKVNARDASSAGSPVKVKAGGKAARTVHTIAAEPTTAEYEPGTPLNTNINDSMATHPTPINVSITSEDNNLNDSRETQETPIVSNATEHARVPQSKQVSSSLRTADPSRPPIMPLRPAISSAQSSEDYHAPIEHTISKEQTTSSQHTGTHSGATIRTEFREDDDTISTLGSLVTKGTRESRKSVKSRKSRQTSTDLSTVTELSEIDRLRKENDRLREELENASQLSSKVSSMYAETLKLENNRLREELREEHEHVTTSQSSKNGVAASMSHRSHPRTVLPPAIPTKNPKDMMYKSTLQTLLENDNMKRGTKKSRRRDAAQQEAVTDFNLLPPAAHLINGVDFDDDSITTYSPIGWNDNDARRVHFGREPGSETAEDMLKKTCSRIATTTRSVASKVKNVAQDINNERRMSGSCSSVSRPLDCFGAFAPRDRMNDSMKTYTTHKNSNSTTRRRPGSSTKSKAMTISEETSTTGSLSDDSLVHHDDTRSPRRRRKKGKASPGGRRRAHRNHATTTRDQSMKHTTTNMNPMPDF